MLDLAGVVAAVGLDKFEPQLKALADAVKNQVGAVPVLNGGGVNQHPQWQAFWYRPERGSCAPSPSCRNNPLRLLHLARIPFFGRLERLALDDAGAGARLPPQPFAQLLPDRLLHALPLEKRGRCCRSSSAARRPARQIAPRATGSQKIEDRVHRRAHVGLAGAVRLASPAESVAPGAPIPGQGLDFLETRGWADRASGVVEI